ncbi:MAG: hypothetical protein CL677_03915 [Bdellovibrionaceae bacterium]|nr:hypothetical protein [Pseudobdellovibrionaceae bacterium]|tara:strand:- start:23458 stop:24090 length:633 start_codon:yes stop_codon:yes gene_type:complete
MSPRKILQDNKGFLAMDFIFGLVLVVGMMVIMTFFAFTLTTIEVAQYIVFSTARVGAVAHGTPNEAATKAQEKFQNIASQPAFAYLNNPNIFSFDSLFTGPIAGQVGDGFDGYGKQEAGEPSMNWGATAVLTPILLDFNLPYFGASTSNSGNPQELATTITSFLGRSPSQGECIRFNNQENRWAQGILSLANEYSAAPVVRYYRMEDNGC